MNLFKLQFIRRTHKMQEQDHPRLIHTIYYREQNELDNLQLFTDKDLKITL